MDLLTTDYHTHILPDIDDGPKYPHDCLQMLEMCKSQGIERVVATPHFIAHQESVETFLTNRQKAFDALPNSPGISVSLGAEVSIEMGLSENDKVRELALAGSKYILLELPYSPLKEWMISEIYNIMYGYRLVPVFAHVDRYLQLYSKDEIHRLLSVREAVLQINSGALNKRRTSKFVISLIHDGYPIIFGSDTHDTLHRTPNMDTAYKALRSKLKKNELEGLVEFNNNLI
ncbi:MAG: capsular polysaccharide biosynthesis protein [Oscillospiraceae bacterium]|nr:capsular polysaccharide biosynthesis protein [Oscillospiraceae bacterium]